MVDMICNCQISQIQVEYMFYSTAENPHLRITKEEEEEYYDKGFIKIDESAICVVCSKYFMFNFYTEAFFFHCSQIFSIPFFTYI